MRYSVLLISSILFFGCQNHEEETAQQMESGQQYTIAYNVLVDEENDDYDIWTVDPESKEKINITNNPDVAWTYRGLQEKVLFISDRDTCRRCYLLYEMNIDGGDIRQISDIRLNDSWMSSRSGGEEILVNPHSSVDSAFYIIDRNGEVLERISTGLPYASDPTFSPDGKQVVFRGGSKESKRVNGYDAELYLMNDDGTNLQRLTEYPKEDTTAAWYAYKSGPPAWHPTENFISYTSFQQGKYSLYAVTPDGSLQWKLTENDYSETYHDWSPDGKWLAVEVVDSTASQYQIALMNWETKELEILTDTTYKFQQSPVFLKTSSE